MRAQLLRYLIIFLVAYALVVGMAMWMETGMVYPAPRADVGNFDHERLGAEEIWLTSEDGTRIHAWYFPVNGNRHTIVFFHGNAENVATCGPLAQQLSVRLNANVLVFDYRGYGKSDGRPFEQGLVADGTAAVNWVCQYTGIRSKQVVYLGRSLGGGVAVQVSRQLEPAALILVSSFTSLTDVSHAVYPWLPVRWLMRNRFESLPFVQRSRVPLLLIHGTDDRIIPFRFSEQLYAASPADPKRLVPAREFGHNDLALENYADELSNFMNQVDAGE